MAGTIQNAIDAGLEIKVDKGGTGATTLLDHGMLVGSGTSAVTALGVGTDGQVLLGSTAADPVFASLTSTGGTIVYTPGAGTLNLEAGGAMAASFPTDSGTATPALGVLTVAGGTNINTSGAAAAVTVNLDAILTDISYITFQSAGGNLITDAVLGAHLYISGYHTGTVSPYALMTVTAGNPPTCDLETTVTINSSYIYRAGGTDIPVADGGLGVSTITAHNLLVGDGASPINEIAAGTNGMVLLGSTGADPVFASLTSTGGTIEFTTGAGTLNVESLGAGGIIWSIITADLDPMVVGNGYICNKAGLLTLTLPTTVAVGTVLRVTGMNTDAGWKVAQSANQQIHFSGSSTTIGAGGSLASTLKRDSIELVCVVADLEWNITSAVGNITIV